MSLINLKNAFGSVCHQYLFIVLWYLNLPNAIVSYIVSCYSELSAHVSTNDWNATLLHIHRGVFQGDSLSPLLFNLAINPLLAYLLKSGDCGYSAQPASLPPTDVPIYVFCSDPSDDSPTGWYRASVILITVMDHVVYTMIMVMWSSQ